MQSSNPIETNFEMVKVVQSAMDNNMENGSEKSTPVPVLIELIQKNDKVGLIQRLDKLGNKESEIFERDRLGRTALHWAADNNDLDLAVEFSKILLQNLHDSSRKKELANSKDIQGRSALIYAAARGNSKLIEYLLLNGSDPTTKEKFNKTVLHFAAEFDDHSRAFQCASTFLSAPIFNSDPKLKLDIINTKELDSERTALHMTAINGNENLMKFLILNGGDVLEVDSNKYTVLHHATLSAYPEKAETYTRKLLDGNLVEESIKNELINKKEMQHGRAPIHIAARRGHHLVLKCLIENGANYLLIEDRTGSTALHLAASLGNETKASNCVAELLKNLSETEKMFLVNVQNNDKFTAMYLAAKHRNVEACKHLLTAGSSFDKKTSHGKTPLEKVYKKIPEAVVVLLDKAVETSGYANRFGSIETYVDMNFAPILGINSNIQNLYKETEELAKIQYAKWDQRRVVLSHPFVKTYIWKKWEKISWIFSLARFFHMLWFISIFVFLVMNYRVNCPFKGGKTVKFSWTGLRPPDKEDGEQNVTSKNLNECDFSGLPIAWGVFNLLGLAIFLFGLYHQTIDRFHWYYKPLRNKPPVEQTTLDKLGIVFIFHYLKAFLMIFPTLSLFLSVFVIIVTVPVFGIFPLADDAQYSIVGLMGFIVWFGFYLEVGKIPLCRVYINLLWKASSTLGLAILIHLPILFGFAAVFVLLMQRMPSFSSASQAIVKVLTLMIGELDYEELFYGEDDKTGNILFAGIEMVALAIFVVFVAVLLLNFLIGLAADEIKDFRERAEVWHLCTQIEQISLLESFVNQRGCKNFLRKKLMLMPPKKGQEQARRLEVYIPTLPKELQRSIHNLNLKTLPEKSSH